MMICRPLIPIALVAIAGCRPSPGAEAAARIHAAEASAHGLMIRDPYAVEPVGAGPVAVYFRVVNGGTTADTLAGATSPAGRSVMLHGMGDGSMAMLMHGVPILAGDSAWLQPGGTHLMLDAPHAPIAAGDTLEVTVSFRAAGSISLRVPVISYIALDQLPADIRPPRR